MIRSVTLYGIGKKSKKNFSLKLLKKKAKLQKISKMGNYNIAIPCLK